MNETIRIINSLSKEDREEFIRFIEEEIYTDSDYTAIFESEAGKVSIDKEIYRDYFDDEDEFTLKLSIEIESKEDEDFIETFCENDITKLKELKEELQANS